MDYKIILRCSEITNSITSPLSHSFRLSRSQQQVFGWGVREFLGPKKKLGEMGGMKFDEQVGYINLCLVVSQIPLQRLVANYCGLVDDILT